MLPELLRFSSASQLLEKIPEDLQAHHRAVVGRSLLDPPALQIPGRSGGGGGGGGSGGGGGGGGSGGPSRALGRAGRHLVETTAVVTRAPTLWDGWGDAVALETTDDTEAIDDDGLDLEELGL